MKRNAKTITPLIVALAGLIFLATLIASRSTDAQSSGFATKAVSPLEESTIRGARRGMPTEPAANTAITAHVPTVVGGETWKVVSYRAKNGRLCAGVTWPGEGQAMSCATQEQWFSRGPVSVEVGARQASGQLLTWRNFTLSGVADLGRVQRLELVLTDCSTRDVPLDQEGLFLDVIGRDLIARQLWPLKLLAYGADGGLVQTMRVLPAAPDTAAARAAGVVAPKPAAACV